MRSQHRTTTKHRQCQGRAAFVRRPEASRTITYLVFTNTHRSSGCAHNRFKASRGTRAVRGGAQVAAHCPSATLLSSTAKMLMKPRRYTRSLAPIILSTPRATYVATRLPLPVSANGLSLNTVVHIKPADQCETKGRARRTNLELIQDQQDSREGRGGKDFSRS